MKFKSFKSSLVILVVSIPVIVLGFFISIFIDKDNNSNLTFIQKARADVPDPNFIDPSPGCQGGASCQGL